MNILKVVTEKLKKKPDLLTVLDLIEVGIYSSHQSAYMARSSGRAPPWLRIPCRGIVYPKDQVIAFLLKAYPNGSKSAKEPEVGVA